VSQPGHSHWIRALVPAHTRYPRLSRIRCAISAEGFKNSMIRSSMSDPFSTLPGENADPFLGAPKLRPDAPIFQPAFRPAGENACKGEWRLRESACSGTSRSNFRLRLAAIAEPLVERNACATLTGVATRHDMNHGWCHVARTRARAFILPEQRCYLIPSPTFHGSKYTLVMYTCAFPSGF
jgi:hypothetical protein